MPTTYSCETKDWMRNIGCLTQAFHDANLKASLVDVYSFDRMFNAHGTFFLSGSKRPTFRNLSGNHLRSFGHNNACEGMTLG